MLYEYLKSYIRTAGLDFTSFKLYIILVNKFLNLLICVYQYEMPMLLLLLAITLQNLKRCSNHNILL